jgi:hypothetical protein
MQAQETQDQFSVNTQPIRDQLRKAKDELKKQDPDHLAPGKLPIDVQIKILKDCFDKLGNIFWE